MYLVIYLIRKKLISNTFIIESYWRFVWNHYKTAHSMLSVWASSVSTPIFNQLTKTRIYGIKTNTTFHLKIVWSYVCTAMSEYFCKCVVLVISTFDSPDILTTRDLWSYRNIRVTNTGTNVTKTNVHWLRLSTILIYMTPFVFHYSAIKQTFTTVIKRRT